MSVEAITMANVDHVPSKITPRAVFKFLRIAIGVLMTCAVIYLAAYYLLRGSMSQRGINAVFGPAETFDWGFSRMVQVSAVRTLSTSLQQAQTEGKPVLLVFTTEHCISCRHLKKFLDTHESLLRKNYVMGTIDFKKSPDNEVVHGKYRDLFEGASYYPWIAILDKYGKLLHSSDGPAGSLNQTLEGQSKVTALPFGCEAYEDRFIEMLQATGPNWRAEEIESLRQAAREYGHEISKASQAN